MLVSQTAVGLRNYWFGERELTREWFAAQLQLAIAALDERYHPEDHVEVEAETHLDFVIRHSCIVDKLRQHLQAVRKYPIPVSLLDESNVGPLQNAAALAAQTLHTLLACEAEFSVSAAEPWRIERWRPAVKGSIDSVNTVLKWIQREQVQPDDLGDERPQTRLYNVTYELRELHSSLKRLGNYLDSTYFAAESGRSLFIKGRAGTGKSHLLARVAEKAAAEGRPVLLLLGNQLRDEILWPQILNRLDIQSLDAEGFLAELDVACETVRMRGLIIVDAINEGPGPRLWRNEFAPFLELIRRYAHLAIVVSCRTEYVVYAVPESLRRNIPSTEVTGFTTLDEQERAARVYLDKRRISRPTTPWMAPEFINPLFLRSCCNALQSENRREFPRGLTGAKEIFSFYVRSTARHLGVGRDGSDELLGRQLRHCAILPGRWQQQGGTTFPLIELVQLRNRILLVFRSRMSNLGLKCYCATGCFALILPQQNALKTH